MKAEVDLEKDRPGKGTPLPLEQWIGGPMDYMDYYDREGKEISLESLAFLLSNLDYKILIHTEVKGLLISTVWLGINHQFGSGPPLIFETMVFREDEQGRPCFEENLFRKQYSTESEARSGHQKVVDLITSVEDIDQLKTTGE